MPSYAEYRVPNLPLNIDNMIEKDKVQLCPIGNVHSRNDHVTNACRGHAQDSKAEHTDQKHVGDISVCPEVKALIQ